MRYRIRNEIAGVLVGPDGRELSARDIADAIERDQDDVILLDIHSPGGSMETELYMLSALAKARRRGKKIVTHTMGYCASAAADILIQGDEIYLGDSAVVLFHNGSLQYESLTDMVFHKASQLFEWVKGGFKSKASNIEFLNAVTNGYVPWDMLLEAYKERKGGNPNGDYLFSSEDLSDIFPGVCLVEDLPEEYASLEEYTLDSAPDGFTEISEEEMERMAAAHVEAEEQKRKLS
jgi:hypothetical protein